MRGAAAPPLFSLPPAKPPAVHGGSSRYAPSNFTVTSEGLMLRYQVDPGLCLSSTCRGDVSCGLLGDRRMDARSRLSRLQRGRPYHPGLPQGERESNRGRYTKGAGLLWPSAWGSYKRVRPTHFIVHRHGLTCSPLESLSFPTRRYRLAHSPSLLKTF